MAIFAEVTENELLNITILLPQYHFQIQLQVWFYYDEIFVNFRLYVMA